MTNSLSGRDRNKHPTLLPRASSTRGGWGGEMEKVLNINKVFLGCVLYFLKHLHIIHLEVPNIWEVGEQEKCYYSCFRRKEREARRGETISPSSRGPLTKETRPESQVLFTSFPRHHLMLLVQVRGKTMPAPWGTR